MGIVLAVLAGLIFLLVIPGEVLTVFGWIIAGPVLLLLFVQIYRWIRYGERPDWVRP